MKLGIIHKAYPLKYGYEAGLERLLRHGYDSLDYSAFGRTHEGIMLLPEKEFEKSIREECAKIEAAGVGIHQTHGPWRWPVNDSTPEERERRFEFFAKAVRGTAYAGTDKCVVHCIMPFGADTDERREEMLEINREFMIRLANVGAEMGVTICLENLPFPRLPLGTVRGVVDFVKEINHKNLKVCLDTGHALVCGEEVGDAVRYIGRDLLAALHVHDNDGTDDQHLRPLEGILDFDSFGKALREIGFNGVFSYETHVNGGPYTEEEQERREIALADFGKAFINKYSLK